MPQRHGREPDIHPVVRGRSCVMMMEETPWTGLVVHLQALKAAWSYVVQGLRKTDYWMKSQTLSNKQEQSPAALISALEDHYLFSPWWWSTQTFIYRIRNPLLLFNIPCVWVWFFPEWYHSSNQTVCNNLWHDSLCLYFVSKAIREQICWTNWFEECQQRLSLSIALPTLTVGEETHFQPQSVASFCRSLIGFLSISASVCQNICVIRCKTAPFIFSKCVVWGLAELIMVIGLMWSKHQTNSTKTHPIFFIHQQHWSESM